MLAGEGVRGGVGRRAEGGARGAPRAAEGTRISVLSSGQNWQVWERRGALMWSVSVQVPSGCWGGGWAGVGAGRS